MKKSLLFLFLPLYAMQPGSPSVGSPSTPKKILSPKEVATAVTVKLFDKPDQEIISAFTRIITKDPKGNLALLEMRWRMIQKLEEDAFTCGEAQ